MKIKVKMVMMSHLSDVHEEIGGNFISTSTIKMKVEFVKWLILHFKDMETEIDADAEFRKFMNVRHDLKKGERVFTLKV